MKLYSQKRNCTFGNKKRLCKGDEEQCIEITFAGSKPLLNDEYKESYLSFLLVFLVRMKGEGVFVVVYKGQVQRALCSNSVERRAII